MYIPSEMILEIISFIYHIIYGKYNSKYILINNFINKRLRYYIQIDNKIKILINLEYFNLYDCMNIIDNGIKKLINLKYINFYYNKNISDIGIKNLINLKHLDLYYNINITNIRIKKLIN